MSTSSSGGNEKNNEANNKRNPEDASSQSINRNPGSIADAVETAETPAPDREILAMPLVPIFYDGGNRRWRRFRWVAVSALCVTIAALLILVVSLFALPLMPRNALPKEGVPKVAGNLDPALTEHSDHDRKLRAKLQHDKLKLQQFAERRKAREDEQKSRADKFLDMWDRGLIPGETPPHSSPTDSPTNTKGDTAPAVVPPNAPPVVTAFYVNWEETSKASALRNIQNLTHILPEWLHLKRGGADLLTTDPQIKPFEDGRSPSDISEITPLARSHNVPILPLLNNYTKVKGKEEGEGTWDSTAVHALVSDPLARTNFITRLRDWLLAEKLQGINIDLESVNAADRDGLTQFMKELYAAFHPKGLLVTQDLELESDGFDYAQLAKWNDWIVPMIYDEHTGETEAGPVASIPWTRKNLAALLKQVPANKIVLGVGNHGYDWSKGQGSQNVTFQDAITAAKESQPDAVIHLDPVSLNPTFKFSEDTVDEAGVTSESEHTIWMQDAVSVFNQLQLARPKGIRGAALWALGMEDPSLWKYYSQQQWGADWGKLVDEGALDTVTYGGAEQIDFDGAGELLEPRTKPSEGKRLIVRDPNTGLITSETYQKDPATQQILLPSPYVVRRYGGTTDNKKKQIVLTFDDGPDPAYTPQILDILKQYRVPAVFFVVGKNAEAYPDLIRRIWSEGHEIGNHSWSHPDMANISVEHQRLQLTSTQRIIQALIGHSTTLFRPPYGNDVEPTTTREVSPLELASEMHYLTVGQKIDPQDWNPYESFPGTETPDTSRPRTADDIVRGVMATRNEGSIVLLHDSGGDRSHTVAALPQIIQQLKAAGYTFVTISQLSGIPRDRLFPAVQGRDTLLVDADRYVFGVSYVVQVTLTALFALSIVLGISRILLFLILALIQRMRERQRIFPVGFTPSVSVIIAAYNEEKVIARTVQSLLDGDYASLEIIVVDDGSRDRTSEVVQQTFAGVPNVRLMRKENGGKASALNYGLLVAQGDIMVSLDADTLFAPDTITRLVRHFADKNVGAVSGNVRVGNTHNIFTKWQSLEYTTSQNFDRRGYDLLNCITVVPGAVGAMRRSAVVGVGGYTHDTLAEDTDLTWKMRRAGWRIVNDNSAMAYTEAPETLRDLAKQRFRWAFGTLQCLWKHRGALGHNGAFGWLALPSLWLYQILFPAISPFMDIGMVFALFSGNFVVFGKFFLGMFAIEFVAAFIALRMDKGDLRLLPWLFLQRFVYRQLMYYVILKSLVAAIRGSAVGWNKLERTGTARIEQTKPT